MHNTFHYCGELSIEQLLATSIVKPSNNYQSKAEQLETQIATVRSAINSVHLGLTIKNYQVISLQLEALESVAAIYRNRAQLECIAQESVRSRA